MQAKPCVWCGRRTRDRLCPECYQKALSTPNLSAAELEALPYGVVKLDSEGKVLAFNRAEEKLSRLSRELVIGRNFFTEVAPCADVREFRGRFEKFLKTGEALTQFDFRYTFESGPVAVHLVMVRVAHEKALLTISKRL